MDDSNNTFKEGESKKRSHDEIESNIVELTEEDILLQNLKTKRSCIEASDFICPVTKQVFHTPVICDDGFTYEKWALDNILNGDRSKISPMTREPISKYNESVWITNSLNNFLNENSEFKQLQFSGKVYYEFEENISIIKKLLNDHNYKKLSEYNGIQLNYAISYNRTIIDIVSRNCKNVEYFSKILDNSIDLDKTYNGILPYQHICTNGNYEMILCALEKNINIEPLCIYCVLINTFLSNKNKKMLIKYLIDKNLNLNQKITNGEPLMYYICTMCTFSTILCALGKNVEIYNIAKDANSVAHLLVDRNNIKREKKIMLIMYLLEHKNLTLLYTNNKKVSIVEKLFKEYGDCEILINKIVDNPTLKISILFNLNVIETLMSYKNYEFLNNYLNTLYQILDSTTAYGISEILVLYGLENYKKNVRCILLYSMNNILCDINESNLMNINDKKDIATKLVDIFIDKINISDIDSDIQKAINDNKKQLCQSNLKFIMEK